jgi:protein-S-isoprenylcysteine O-methyltransferase Ste14
MKRAAVGSVFAFFAVAASLEAARAWERVAAEHSARPTAVAGYLTLKAVVVLLFMLFVLLRDPPRRRSRNPVALASCVAAIGSVVALRAPAESANTGIVVTGDLITLASWVWLLIAAVALGRCFGVLPEARGLVTSGPYAFVRHPLYLGEFGAFAGLVLASPILWNLVLAIVFAVAQAVRMRLEEKELASVFPEYVEYARETPRLVPRVRMADRGTLAREAS